MSIVERLERLDAVVLLLVTPVQQSDGRGRTNSSLHQMLIEEEVLWAWETKA
jgi:hypothetical protein